MKKGLNSIMWTNQDIEKWLKNFDVLNYPSSVYEELVVEGKEAADKFAVMGSWKNNSLRESIDGKDYQDQFGRHYRFTERWKAQAPVGYDVWQYITNHQAEIKDQIPDRFTAEEPEIVKHLCAKPGFGFIWTQFVLHCFYPKQYPLYDQHVYRAYCYLTTNGTEVPLKASYKWEDYADYRQFFLEVLANSDYNYWELDRALWAFGKSVKINKKTDSTKHPRSVGNALTLNIFPKSAQFSDTWCYDLTLGGKQKLFWWRINSPFSLSILRDFKGGKLKPCKTITTDELTAIHDYVRSRSWTDLANNVENLKAKKEKEGLGKFLHEQLNWNISHAQLASQLFAIFVHTGVWLSNNQKIGIQVKAYSDNWKSEIETYYSAHSDDEISVSS